MGAARVALQARHVLLHREVLAQVHRVVAWAQIVALRSVLHGRLRLLLLLLPITLVADYVIYVYRLAVFLSKEALIAVGRHQIRLVAPSGHMLSIHKRLLI